MIGKHWQPWQKGLPVLGIIWLGATIVDRLWFAIDQTVPAWDQAEYLSGALTYWRTLQTPQWASATWWTELWQRSSKTPPLVYLLTVPLLNLFGVGADQSTLVNLLFNAILLASVYALGTLLFSVRVGLGAALLCAIMPGLYEFRLEYLLDFPLAAMVTLTFACLTGWRQVQGSDRRSQLQSWLLAASFGISLGLTLLVKQSGILFLLVPIVWFAVQILRRRQWRRLAQGTVAIALATSILLPWYRTNWLLILTGSKRATIDSAIAEGDPSLLSLDAWTYYLKQLPALVSLPLLLVPIAGFLLFWRRSRISSVGDSEPDYAPKANHYRQQKYLAARRSLAWLGIFLTGAYLLSSLNLNKDGRYGVPFLPVLSLVLAYGFCLLPKRWKKWQWGAIGLAIGLMLFDLSPASAIKQKSPRAANPIANFPHTEVITAVKQADPYLKSTIGVLPSTAEINQHNINYYGLLQNQVNGRQVGTQMKQVEQDRRSLPWFLTKTNHQGSIDQQKPQLALTQAIAESNDFTLHKSWNLPDNSSLNLFRWRIPLLEVKPIVQPTATAATIELTQVIVPAQAPAGKPIPVTYQWTGSWEALRSGLVVLTWRRQEKFFELGETQWLHDHGLGMGNLLTDQPIDSATRFQVVERMAMLPPRTIAKGTYTLEATYLDRQTGKTTAIAVPPIRLKIDPKAPVIVAPEVDWVTQLRNLALTLPQGLTTFDRLFSEVGRINQYAPGQDYLDQARQAIEYRLQQEPQNLRLAYGLALTQILKRRAPEAIAALEQVVQLDPQNPFAHAYLAFVNLYDFRPRAAQTALNAAFALEPNLPELHALNGVAALMQGNLVEAGRSVQVYRQIAS